MDAFLNRFGKDELKVIPGISSFQYLFSKLSKSWKNYEFISLHGRDFREFDFSHKLGAFFLTDKKNSPAAIADSLIDNGLGDYKMIVGENLSYEDERIIVSEPEVIANMSFSDLCVVVVEKDEAAVKTLWV